MKLRYSIALSLPLASASAMAADLALKLDVPQLNVAEYHRPYIAAWLENADQKVVANIAVLYDTKKKDNAGTKWLKDMRQWWRKSGRELTMPMDGVSGATKAPGELTLTAPKARWTSCRPASTRCWWKRRAKRAAAKWSKCRWRGRRRLPPT
jgi:hypothetical protein